MDLTGVGVWSSQLRYSDPGEAAESAAELEELGFEALWMPDAGGPVMDSVENLLTSTKRTVIATGILNLWMHEPSDVAAKHAALTAAHGDRFLLGIGASNASLVDSLSPGRFGKPLAATRAFLDALDAADQPVPVESRVLAALGPKMLELAATRTCGVHPYLSTPDQTHQARGAVGDGALLLPEQTVILTDDRAKAQAIGTDWLRTYLAFPNYANRMVRSGFTEDDVATLGDGVFDAIIAWGDEDAIVKRVNEQRAAGADHVCIQVLTADQMAFPRDQWRRLAAALI